MSTASEVEAYLAALPAERREALSELRMRIRRGLPRGYVERLQHGMICFVVPPARFAATYNGQPLALLALAAQKQHLVVHLLGLYTRPDLMAWFREAYAATGKRLDMGKACLRFKRVEDVALDVLERAAGRLSVTELIAAHEQVHAARRKRTTRAER